MSTGTLYTWPTNHYILYQGSYYPIEYYQDGLTLAARISGPAYTSGAAPVPKVEHAKITVSLESAGYPVMSHNVTFLVLSGAGRLDYAIMQTRIERLVDETSYVVNTISGVSQCQTANYIDSVEGVYLSASGVRSGENLYVSHDEKVIDLNVNLETGAELLVTYFARGVCINYFLPTATGDVKILVSADADKEVPLTRELSLSVSQEVVTAPEIGEGTTTTTTTTATAYITGCPTVVPEFLGRLGGTVSCTIWAKSNVTVETWVWTASGSGRGVYFEIEQGRSWMTINFNDFSGSISITATGYKTVWEGVNQHHEEQVCSASLTVVSETMSWQV